MQELIINENNIKDKIHTIRNQQVILDRDLAELYGVETKVLNQAVKRNEARFPNDFMFQLSKEEFENWRSQFVTSNSDKMGLRRPPYAFTEQGVSMLSAVLKSDIAINISVKIIRAFVEMRKMINSDNALFYKIDFLEKRQISYELKTDTKINQILNALEDKKLKLKQGIFYDGQIFDAYVFVNDLLKNAVEEVILIDNYVDETVFTLFSKYPNIKIKIYTSNITKQLKLDFEKYKKQYNNIEIIEFKNSHDRFLIIDKKEIYHIGASLKDLGKKWFAFSKFEIENLKILERLK
ncbi:ORF6N domain-containing protein [Arcobacter lacus]|uniref:ORF6N domain-containing protein n=1 Tax=Arcobacter lacus TaxID=1912876 RepID=UPI0021BB8B33|nr:ORF6N domain-containing protein [Arcobacter lacus]MCT7911378.1 ORF6N domain-containing protein [Arcobacter lacus]